MEPGTTPLNQQLAAIAVEVGDPVTAGQLLGQLVMYNAASHVHWGVADLHHQICPDPLLAQSVRTALLALIHEDHPSWMICY
jgi:Na+-translocating ferredoxin:NAD+ oxidoreductase RnfC subunit